MREPAAPTVLLLGGTGRTGARALRLLLERGAAVRAVVRSTARLPPGLAGHPRLAVTEASLLSLSDEALLDLLRGCDVVVSCLGHVLDLAGVLGPPRDLVTRAVARLARAIEALRPATPVKLVLMSSVSVHRPGGLDARRGRGERAFLWVLRRLLPPAQDNQRAADHLLGVVGPDHAHLQWVIVRPDTLQEGDRSAYSLHEGLVGTLLAPGRTRMANVAHFMAELATDPRVWAQWQGKLPVIVDAGGAR